MIKGSESFTTLKRKRYIVRYTRTFIKRLVSIARMKKLPSTFCVAVLFEINVQVHGIVPVMRDYTQVDALHVDVECCEDDEMHVKEKESSHLCTVEPAYLDSLRRHENVDIIGLD